MSMGLESGIMSVKERPILFSGEMVRAILAGRKTQTRRVVKPQPTRQVDSLVFPWATFYDNGHVHTWNERGVGGENWDARDFPEESEFSQALRRTEHRNPCPYGVPGDRMWVRETWARGCVQVDDRDKPYIESSGAHDFYDDIFYRADYEEEYLGPFVGKWVPSIHMPRKECRLVLEVADVRLERLNAIKRQDAWQEGVECRLHGRMDRACCDHGLRGEFIRLWGEINNKPGKRWEDNPWVWVVEFKKIDN